MRGIGVLEGGHAFTEEEIARGRPRWWWGRGRRTAYERVLLERGLIPHTQDRRSGHDHEGGDDGWPADRDGHGFDRHRAVGAAAGAVFAAKATEATWDDEKSRSEGGSGWGAGDGGSGGDSGGSGSSGE